MIEVMYFGAKWCMPCKMMHPILDKLSSEFQHINFIKVDVDEDQEAALEYKISAVPTLIILNNGDILHRLVGMQNEGVLRETLNKIK